MKYQLGARKNGVIQNIRLISINLDKDVKTAIDIGCNEGAITAHLDSLGVKAFGFEANQNYATTAADFQKENFSEAEIINHALKLEDIEELPLVDAVFFLSVNQQLAKIYDTEYSEKFMLALFKKAKYQFFFQPCMIHEKYGSSQLFIENNYQSAKEYFDNLLLQSGEFFSSHIVGLSENRLPASEPFRPLILYTKNMKPQEVTSIPHLSDDVKTLTSSPSKLFTIDINKAIGTRDLQSYSHTKGKHRFVETVKYLITQLDAGVKNIKLEETPLYHYYLTFNPKKYRDVWHYAGLDTDIGVLGEMPLFQYVSWVPWLNPNDTDLDIQNGISQEKQIPEWDRHAFGPMSDKNILNELNRLTNLLVEIRKNGYQPEVHGDGYIRGRVINYKNESRFHVYAGQHRLAVLSALGYKQILVKKHPGTQPLYISNIADLPMVKRNLLTETQAENFLDGLFSI